MSEERLPEAKPLYADKKAALKVLEKVYEEIGFVPDHSGTIEELHQQMIAEGIRPEDNIFSREMIALRYPNEIGEITMTDEWLPEAKPLFVDRQVILKALEELNAATGFVPVPGATAEHARELMRETMEAQGVRPEDNAASREMIALRYPDDQDNWE